MIVCTVTFFFYCEGFESWCFFSRVIGLLLYTARGIDEMINNNLVDSSL